MEVGDGWMGWEGRGEERRGGMGVFDDDDVES